MTIEPSAGELEALHKWIRNKVRLYVGEDGSSREDVTQQTITDYWKYAKKHGVYSIEEDNTEEESSVLSVSARALAHSILKRRVADHYRQHVFLSTSHLAASHDLDETSEKDDPSHYRRLLHEAVLLELTQWMTQQSTSDRDLLLRDISIGSSSNALSPSERKRLSRLRSKANDILENKFGEPLNKLLSE